MPLLYTHIRFGNKCTELLQDEYKEIIKNNYLCFLYGTQGPNILYYHSPITNKKYIEQANKIHSNNIVNTLSRIKTIFKDCKSRDSVLAYSLGYITHFILDSYINSYLENSSKIINTDISSLKSEIEKYYLKRDNMDINNILKTLEKAKISYPIISKVLNIQEKETKQSISNMIQYEKILNIKNKQIMKFLRKISKALKIEKYFSYFTYSEEKYHSAQIIRIAKYFEISKYHYQILAQNFINYIFNNEQLNEYFFNSFININNTPVLDFNEEKKYIIKDYYK